ncbi:hypothetical protein CcCBS67573_g10334 [Chytriomyces confervae]|uniref:Histone deacetylase 8 n=1 Tax=Chytriomyces confervae TaxID=246404 RepID=A0A507D3Q4_9FUNG|nr:hypothetical protein CcCBS67573_g10334 [Chytriomyces confervae]
MEAELRVAYVHSPALAKAASKLPSNLNRSAMVHSMILDAFCAGKWMRITAPVPITKDDLTQFHSEEFVELLLSAEYLPSDESKEHLQQLDEFGLLHDCPVFPGLGDYVKQAAGGTIAAVRQLMNGSADVAIHWDGGRHHAHRDFASGFCYVNDIVLGILELHKKFKKVLYIDLGTGSSSDMGSGKGKKHALNIPLPPSTTSETFLETFKETLQTVLDTKYPSPNVIVMQCGLDGCRADPLVQHGWKLDSFVIGNCVRNLLDVVDVPVLLLGGGGYSNSMAARGWTYATLQVLKGVGAPVLGASDESTDNFKLVEIPEHQYFDNYIPECLLTLVDAGSSTSSILTYLKDKFENQWTTRKEISNEKAAARKQFLGSQSPIQALYDIVSGGGFIYKLKVDASGSVNSLFFVHESSANLAKCFSNTFVMDCTYKTNRFRMPLLNIVGITATYETFNAGFAFICNETESEYIWALTAFSAIVVPGVIVTDRELSLMNAITAVFPSTHNLLCVWHVNKKFWQTAKGLDGQQQMTLTNLLSV